MSLTRRMRPLLWPLVLLLAACAQPERLPPSAVSETLRGLSFEPPERTAAAPARPAPSAAAPSGTAAKPELWFGRAPAAPAAPPPAGVRRTGAGVELSLERASLSQFLDLVLGRVLGVGYTVSAPLEGEVSLASAGPLDEDQLFALVETVLRAHGAALVRTGPDTYAVVPAQIGFGGAEVAVGEGLRLSPGFGITVVPLRHLSAEAAARLVSPILPERDRVQIDERRNLLIVVGTAAERRYAVEALRAMDVDWMAGRSVGLFPLARATPEAVIRELEAIMLPPGGVRERDSLRLLPVERLNAVLAIATDPDQLVRVEQWVRRLDRGRVAGIQFSVYELRHVPAKEMADLLNAALADLQVQPAAATAVLPPAPAVPEAVAGPAEGPPPPVVREAVATVPAGPANPLAEVKVVPLESANALLIRGTPQAIELVEATLARLDRPPLQVLIEASIVEVLLTDELRYGVQYFLDSQNIRTGFNVTGPEGTVGKGLLEPLAQLPGFNFIYTGGNANITIDLLSRLTDLRVLSSPSLVVEDNRTATLVVGDEVPVVIRTAQTVSDPNAPLVSEVQFRKTGVILEVTPHINAGDLVSLEIAQEVSRVADRTGAGGNPVIQQRRIESRVSITSGQTVVLGGLIQDSDSRGRSKVPVLGDMPLLGELFSHNRSEGVRTELLVFLTPRVVRSAEDARAVSEELRARMRAFHRPQLPRTPVERLRPPAPPATPPDPAPDRPAPQAAAAPPASASRPPEAGPEVAVDPSPRREEVPLQPVRFAPPRPAPEAFRVRVRHLPRPPRALPPVPVPRPEDHVVAI